MYRQFIAAFLLISVVACGQEQKKQSKLPVVTSKSTPSVFPAETGDFKTDMLNFVNAVRARGCKCGNTIMPAVPPLTWDDQLEKAAQAHAKDMARQNRLDHRGSDGSSAVSRVEKVGYKWMVVGENIASGQENLQQVIVDWFKSPSHCKQLMNERIVEMGAARYDNFWVQDFGKKR